MSENLWEKITIHYKAAFVARLEDLKIIRLNHEHIDRKRSYM